MTDHRCHRGARCAHWEAQPDTNKRLGARINADHGLCDGCTRHLGRALGELPRDYVDLHQTLARGSGGQREHVSATAERPIPIRLDVDALQGEIAHETLCWAESTADVLGIRWDTQHARDARPGHTVQRSCALLGNSLSVLLALRNVQHTGWVYGCWAVLTRDGIDAATVLLDLHHRARALTGQLRMINQLPAPCPRCDSLSLQRDDGSDCIDCAACGRRYTWCEYERLCTILADRKGCAA